MTEFLDVPGGRIAYDVTGSGPLVVLSHGIGDRRQPGRRNGLPRGHDRPAGGSTVIGTCTGDPSCLSGASPRAAARPGSGRRTIEVISGTIRAPG